MYFLVIQYSSLVKQNVTYMNRNITIQHNHADKLREGQDMNKKENHSVKSEIEQALLRLMTQKSYLDITVTDIVQEAKVARVSFTGISLLFRKCWTVSQMQLQKN